MIEIINNFLSKEQCSEIIKLSDTNKWFVVQQGHVEVETLKCYIKPKIKHIIDNLPIELEDSTCVELLKYEVGALSRPHIDSEGTHVLSPGNYIFTEWKRTGIVLLNDEFDGGVLKFPKLYKSFDKTCIGDLILFDAGKNSFNYQHEVSEITNGIRYTLVFRFI